MENKVCNDDFCNMNERGICISADARQMNGWSEVCQGADYNKRRR